MTYTPIPHGTPDWDVPVNAAFTDQDARIDAAQADADTALATATSLAPVVNQHTVDIDAAEAGIAVNSAAITNLQTRTNGEQYFLLVAANDAAAVVKNKADYVCDGVADDAQIQAAIDAAKAQGGGIVQLSGGTFNLAATVNITGNIDEDNADTITLRGVGAQATTLTMAVNVNGISLTNWAMVNISDLGINISGTGRGIMSTGVTSGDTLSFWHSSFRNLQISGGYVATSNTYGMWLEMPWRSVFENIEILGTRNGIQIINNSAVQNAGDCVFNRMFVEIVGTDGYGLYIDSIDGNMNQNDWIMFEAGANGANCTGIFLDGAAGTASQRFIGTNLEQFKTLINVANGESNVFDLNYVTCDTGGVGNTAFMCGANAYNNTFSAKWVNVASGDTLKIIDDANTTSNCPNIFERIRIENNPGGTVTYSKTNSTVLRDITTFNTGNPMPDGLLQYPLSTVNDPTFTPADHGLITWTHDPATLRSAAERITSGSVYLNKVKIVNRSTVVSNIHYGVVDAGATLTAGQNFVGLYNSSGTLLATSADQTTAFGSAGAKTAAITPQTLAVGNYYIAILAVGTTPPSFAQGNGASSVLNTGLTTGTSRSIIGPTAQTSLPASITLGAQSGNNGARWGALS